MSTDSDSGSHASDPVAGGEQVPRKRYCREELLGIKEQPNCQILPEGLTPDDLSDLMESVFFDKGPTFERASSDTLYLGPQRGPPPGLRTGCAVGGQRRTGFAPSAPLHSRLVEDGRSLSPDRDSFLARAPSSGLTSAFASPAAKAPPLPAARNRFDDASRMDRWDSNKQPGGGAGGMGMGKSLEEDSWTPRGRGSRAGDWRGGGGAEPSPSAPGVVSRPSMDRASSGWGGREAAGGGAGPGALSRQSTAGGKDTGGRWVKEDPDDWRARKASGAGMPEPRFDWSDRGGGLGGPAAGREGPPGAGAAPKGHRGVPEWADDGTDANRGPVTAADIEAERQRMQAQWKAQRDAQKAQRAQHEEAEEYPRAEESHNTFLPQPMADDDFEDWARQEKAKQEAEDRAEAERATREAAAPKAGQQIDVKALFGGAAAAAATPPAASGPAAVAAPVPPAQPAPGAGGENAVRSRFANFFKLEDQQQQGQQAQQGAPPSGTPAGQAGPQQGQRPSQQAQQGGGAAASGSVLLAMLKQQAPEGAGALAGEGGGPGPGEGPGAGATASLDAELDDVSKVAMSAALQGLDEALGEEEGVARQAHQPPPAQPPQQAQQPFPMHPQTLPQHAPPAGMPPGFLQSLQAGGLPSQQQQAQQALGGGGYRPTPAPTRQYSPVPAYNGALPHTSLPQYAGGGFPGVPLQQQQAGQYRAPMGSTPLQQQQAALLQQHAQHAQQNALLAQLLAAQQRQHAQQQQGAGQINLAALLAASQGGGGAKGGGALHAVPPQQPYGVAHLVAQQRGGAGPMGQLPPNLGQLHPQQPPQQGLNQAQLLQHLQMAAASQQAQQQRGGGGMGGGPALAAPPQQGPGGMTVAQQQQLLGMLRMSTQQQRQ